MCTQVLPVLDQVKQSLNAEVPNVETEFLQGLAELTPAVHPSNSSKPIDVAVCHQAIFEKLVNALPLPEPGNEADDFLSGLKGNQLKNVESLLYAFHQLGKHNAEVLNEANLKNLKMRLNYLARNVQKETKQIREALDSAKKAKEDMQSVENQERLAMLKATSNVSTIIKDLFHVPPSFKTTVVLSWKPLTKGISAVAKGITPVKSTDTKNGSASEETSGKKRKAIEAPEGSAEKVIKKDDRAIYAPPSGKFSQNRSSFAQQSKD